MDWFLDLLEALEMAVSVTIGQSVQTENTLVQTESSQLFDRLQRNCAEGFSS